MRGERAEQPLDSAGIPFSHVPWQYRWWASSRRTRVLLAVAAALTALAGVAGVAAARARPAPHEVLIAAPASRIPATVDAAGCPSGLACSATAHVAPALGAAFDRFFPGATVVYGETTNGPAGAPLRRSLVGWTRDGAQVSVLAQCIPGGAAISARVERWGNSSLDMVGDLVVHSRRLVVVRPGAPGCTASVQLDTLGRAQRYERQALDLAGDPAVQVRP